MKKLKLDIMTPERKIFSGAVLRLKVRAVDGELGVYPGHAPLATVLDAGAINYRLENGEEKSFFGKGGFLIVKDDQASILGSVFT